MEASSRSELDVGEQRTDACQISRTIQEMKIPRTESSKGGGNCNIHFSKYIAIIFFVRVIVTKNVIEFVFERLKLN